MCRVYPTIGIFFSILLFSQVGWTQPVLTQDPDLKKIDVLEHLGVTIPLDAIFQNTNGDAVRIGQYFQQGKPVIMCMYYTNCPMLCSLVLTGLSKGISDLAWKPGDKFQMLSVSMDPVESYVTAAAVKDRYLGSLGTGLNANAWDFLVGNDNQIHALTDALGFKYFKVVETGQFAHPAVVFVLTGSGKISRYLYGVEFKESDLRLALLEASEGKIGTTLDHVILFCYHYDPDAKGYVLAAMNIMKLGGIITMFALAAFLGWYWIRERHRASKSI